VYYRIIGITRKGALREVPLHPCVERIVHEQIHQHRADHSTLRCTSRSWQSRPICSLEWRSQPPLDIQQKPVHLDVLAYRLEQEVMIDLIKGNHDRLPHSKTFLKQSSSHEQVIHSKACAYRSSADSNAPADRISCCFSPTSRAD